ncbi:hypothetical protein [Cryobacterium sp. Y82]|uniref:hypothetical protein n=1 Tax=Cryobacterium sp. Y82 TaxID=2045017 RepID=UPI000CE374D4|nr:hypothetical protein [Cryobacterium sp. Y82]
MYWSIYDALMVVTGYSSAAIAFMPGITNKVRAISVAVEALLMVAALITGSRSRFCSGCFSLPWSRSGCGGRPASRPHRRAAPR